MKKLEKLGRSLSREEQRRIFGGLYADDLPISLESAGSRCYGSTTTCYYEQSGSGPVVGSCSQNSNNKCVCSNGTSSVLHESCVRMY